MENQETTKDRLIEAAGREFAEKGFDQARIRTICERAGANLAAVNYHFGDKERLYREVLLEAYRRRSSVVLPSLGDATAAEKLRAFIRFFFNQVVALKEEDSWQTRMMAREVSDPTSALDEVIRDWVRPRFEMLKSIMREIRPEADDRRLNALCFSVVGQCLMYRLARTVTGRLIGPEGDGLLDDDYLADHVATFTLAALGLGPPFGRDAGETPDV
ncbi:CerR family C-terminal domain-containing protein [Planctomyces sp. SH-PL62]|uniref:CerR family C-terminal domain-containing protein n=1 Tax=Planctomyces sp. SH-PL62 TaxID=1636152 RepID=UPI00078BB753|nr:CerR family C-terminal domain-containing protein [Planctomyces sp. SH-PL62]AMV39768.1 putative HTH-type transcriptional regulator YttP [Planctomyces sp. SH-PL62]